MLSVVLWEIGHFVSSDIINQVIFTYGMWYTVILTEEQYSNKILTLFLPSQVVSIPFLSVIF